MKSLDDALKFLAEQRVKHAKHRETFFEGMEIDQMPPPGQQRVRMARPLRLPRPPNIGVTARPGQRVAARDKVDSLVCSAPTVTSPGPNDIVTTAWGDTMSVADLQTCRHLPGAISQESAPTRAQSTPKRPVDKDILEDLRTREHIKDMLPPKRPQSFNAEAHNMEWASPEIEIPDRNGYAWEASSSIGTVGSERDISETDDDSAAHNDDTQAVTEKEFDACKPPPARSLIRRGILTSRYW